MKTINDTVHSWDRHGHRGIAELDSGKIVQVHARNLGAAQRHPEWKGPFQLYGGDRAEIVINDDGRVTDVLRTW
ncbi:hypothetical protein [Bradyrhizobium sp. DASA03007]|uniref:hypothetical protein n=1 Tax=unclassified Bradyrhizobium TaxID=2631580 RepID=UPI003F6FB120